MLNWDSRTLKFSVSGLRGVFPDDIHPGNIPQIIRAWSETVAPGAVAVARDARASGPAILEITRGVLRSLGRDVYDLGLVPTPTIKAFVSEMNLAGGLMVSASHNPPEYNAFKFITRGGFFFDTRANSKFRKHLENPLAWRARHAYGSYFDAHEQAVSRHIKCVLKAVPHVRGSGVRVAIDPVASCALSVAPAFLEHLGISWTGINMEESTRFPRPPEPVGHALDKLSRQVRSSKADIGFAFDPDSDRFVLCGTKGALSEEITLVAAIRAALRKRKGDVVVNLSSSWLNRHVASEAGRKVWLSEVGEANVVNLMRRKRAAFGGEGNGGVIDPRIPSYGRDAIAAMAWTLHYIETIGNPLDLPALLPLAVMKKVAVPVDPGTEPEDIFKRIRSRFADFQADNRDGLHLSAKSGIPWLHVRLSNTEPVMRIIAEATSQTETDTIINQVQEIL